MKTKKEHIDFWLSQAEDDWTAVDTLLKGRNFLQSLFFAHFVIEKICKALWIKHNEENVPPRTYNLIHLLSTTPIELNDDKSEFMFKFKLISIRGSIPRIFNKYASYL